MQLTGSAFLFVFLPLSLLPVILLPKKHRRLALSLLSVIWYILANHENLPGLLHIGALVSFAVLITYLPAPRTVTAAKLRTTIGVTLPILSLLSARIVSEYFNTAYRYPMGLLFVTLGVVSYTVDQARGDVIRPRNPLELIGYLLFFPTLIMGPVLKSKQYFDLTEEPAASPELFCAGIRAYMLGYIKRIAVAAVLMRAMGDLLTYGVTATSPLSLFLLLLFSYLYFYFFVTGSADLARGVCAMYGIRLPRDRGNAAFATTPDRMLYGTMLSLRTYLLDYAVLPLRRKWTGVGGKFFTAVLLFVITVLVFRTRAESLLFALPVLVFALLSRTEAVKKMVSCRQPLRILLTALSAMLCSFFTLSILLKEPLQIFSLIIAAFGHESVNGPFYILGAMQDSTYLLIVMAVLFVLYPLAYLRKPIRRKVSERTQMVLSIISTALLFGGFLISLIYFMPQFPLYAEYAYGIYRM